MNKRIKKKKKKKMKYVCPVCFYDQLTEEPYDEDGYGLYEICVCCGFQFGLDDYPDKEKGQNQWRDQWIKNGAKWWSSGTNPPKGWDSKIQLNKHGYKIK